MRFSPFQRGSRGGRAQSTGKVAVVTGAAAGLGAVYATRLAELGHDVAVCDLESPDATVRAIRATGARAFGACADACSPEDVKAFADGVRRELGPVEILVNNVGISPFTPFEEITLEEWRRVMTVNLDSLLLMTQAFLPDMKAAAWGRIVNVTSLMAWDAQSKDVVHYVTSKSGVLGFTRSLASEVGVHGITVNAICPGIIRTPVLDERLPAERWERYLERQAIKQIAEPRDLLAALTMLVSPESGFITAVNVPVHGGRVWA